MIWVPDLSRATYMYFPCSLRMDGYMEELAPIPASVEIYRAIRGCYITIRELVFMGSDKKDLTQKAGRAILTANAIKRKTVIPKMNCDKMLLQAGADDLKDMLDLFQEMNKINMGEDKMDTGRSTPTSLKLTREGSCCLTDDEKKKLASQLRESGGPAHIPVEECKLLMNTVGKSIASYSPGTSDLASLPSAAPLMAFIANAATRFTGPKHIRRVPSMALLKLTTLRMTLGDRWDLVFFGPLVAKNGEMVSNTIKKESNQFSEATYTSERQDLWAKIDTMENFGIAARGLALAADLLVHPSIITKGEILEWFLFTACLFEEYDAQLHVQKAVQLFREGVTLYYTRIRACLEGTEEQLPPRITVVPDVLKQRVAHLREVTRHRVGPSIIPDQGAGLTGCNYLLKTAIDCQGKSVTISKDLKRAGPQKEAREEDEITPVFKKPRKDKTTQH